MNVQTLSNWVIFQVNWLWSEFVVRCILLKLTHTHTSLSLSFFHTLTLSFLKLIGKYVQICNRCAVPRRKRFIAYNNFPFFHLSLYFSILFFYLLWDIGFIYLFVSVNCIFKVAQQKNVTVNVFMAPKS